MSDFKRISSIESDGYEMRMTVVKDDGLILLTASCAHYMSDLRDWVSIVRWLTFDSPETFAEWPDLLYWLKHADSGRIRQWQLLSRLDPHAVLGSLTAKERRRWARMLDKGMNP